MDHHYSGYIITLVNSIIGVSILAMPYCFKQCGIILAIVILVISNLLTRVTCHFLLKSANIARRRTFEYLAFHTFGALGKFSIEVGMIGFLIGTCIAFFVVMGDLGPEIVSEITNTQTSNTMRTSILMALALFCVFPLGLLRNVDSLIGISRATIGFYVCLVLKIFFEALPHLYKGDWITKVELWKPAGVLQVLPIVSMALFCQTQLFEIYQAIEHPTLEKLNQVVKSAVNICTAVYFFVGFFGYVAFANKSFGGNILLSFTPSFITNAMKLGFILSLAFSFPLVIFPCRQSLYSLLYREGYSLHESTSNYIPEGKFKGITMFIVFTSLVVSILIPTIEVVLGLIGSTIGVIICLVFPVTCFICISPKDTNERHVAKFVLIFGISIMVLGTYANLRSLEKIESPFIEKENRIIIPKLVTQVKEIKTVSNAVTALSDKKIKFNSNNVSKVTDSPEVRHEPPQPIEIVEEPKKVKKPMQTPTEKKTEKGSEIELKIEKPNEDIKKEDKVPMSVAKEGLQPKVILEFEDYRIIKSSLNLSRTPEKENNQLQEAQRISNYQAENEAIEIDEEAEKAKHHVEEDHKILLETIQKQQEVQDTLVKQQKKLIEVIEKEHQIKEQEKLKNEVKLEAVKKIENMAIEAIERISGGNKEVNRMISEDLEIKVHKVITGDHKKEANNVTNDILKEKNENIGNLRNTNLEKDISQEQEPPSLVPNVKEEINVIPKADTDKEDKNAKSDVKSAFKQVKSANGIIKPNEKPVSNDIVEETKLKMEEIVKDSVKDINNLEHKTGTTNSVDSKNNSNDQPTYQSSNLKIEPQVEQLAAAPLFLNLGSKNTGNTKEEKLIKKAVPIAIRLMNASSNFTLEKDLKKNKDTEEIKSDDNEVKVLRRDILSYVVYKRK